MSLRSTLGRNEKGTVGSAPMIFAGQERCLMSARFGRAIELLEYLSLVLARTAQPVPGSSVGHTAERRPRNQIRRAGKQAFEGPRTKQAFRQLLAPLEPILPLAGSFRHDARHPPDVLRLTGVGTGGRIEQDESRKPFLFDRLKDRRHRRQRMKNRSRL